jgi:hypothetical protein
MMTTVLIVSLVSPASADVKTDPPPNRGEPRVAAVDVCASAHVQNIGWQGDVCGSNGRAVVVGTTGQGLRMEALALRVS